MRITSPQESLVAQLLIVCGILLIAYQIGYRGGFQAASEMRKTTQSSTPAHVVAGTIVSITDGTVTVRMSAIPNATTQIATNESTVFERIEQRDPTLFESEQRDYNALTASIRTYCTPPASYTMQNIRRADLRSGDRVTVLTTASKGAERVLAERIIVEPTVFASGTTVPSNDQR